MSVIALGTALLSPIKKDILYEGRVAFGEMLMSLNWKKVSIWTFAPCMEPIADLKWNRASDWATRYTPTADSCSSSSRLVRTASAAAVWAIAPACARPGPGRCRRRGRPGRRRRPPAPRGGAPPGPWPGPRRRTSGGCCPAARRAGAGRRGR